MSAPPIKPPMSSARVLWLLFCLAWFAFWLLFGWLFLPFLNLILAAGSLGAIFIPVGKPPRPRLITPGFERLGDRFDREPPA